MSGLIRKAAAVRDYMNLTRKIGFKPAGTNLRRMTIPEIKSAFTELKRYAKNLSTSEIASNTVKHSNKRSEVIRSIKEINPNFKSLRTDTYNDLLRKYRENLPTRSFIGTINKDNVKTFFAAPIDDKSITISAADLLKSIDQLRTFPNFFLTISDGSGNHRMLTNVDKVKAELRKHVAGFELKNSTIEHGSDTELAYEIVKYDGFITLTWQSADVVRRNLSGAFFKYHNCTEFDLTRYQIFKRGLGKKENKDCCLIHAFKHYGISIEKINDLKMKMFSREIKNRDLRAIAYELGVTIKLFSDNQSKFFNKGCDEIISLGLVDGHYFINETTEITGFTIKNYELCKTRPSFPSCRNAKGKKAKKLSSFEVIKLIFNEFRETLLKPISLSNIADRQCVDKLNDYDTLHSPRYFCECVKNNSKLTYKDFLVPGVGFACECTAHNFKYKNDKKLILNEIRDYSLSGDSAIFKGKFKKNNPNDDYQIWFIDTETSIDSSTGYHTPSCLCAIKYCEKSETFQEYTFFGFDCVKEFLESLSTNAVIYAHNMAFDFRMFVDHLDNLSSPIEAGTKLKQVAGKYGFHYLVFKDSYSFLPVALKNLPSMLHLDSGDKEVFPYTLIDKWTYDKKIPLTECRKHIKNGLRKAFKLNAIKIGAFEDGKVDMEKYTIHYCMQDTRILAQAFTKFRKQILEVCKIDILPLISLPQLSDKFLKQRGVYNGCFSFSGIAQDFIRRCCVGGRVMTSENQKWNIQVFEQEGFTSINGMKIIHKSDNYTKNEKTLIRDANNYGAISDFDAVSLYPSAMSMLPGFIKGIPKVLSKKQVQHFDFIRSKFDAYFVEIRVLSHSIDRDFPLLSIKNDSGVRDFTNDIDGKNFYVDNITLEDLITFQGVNFEVIRGYYFNEGFNTEIKNTINFMFNERLKLKKEGNNLQNVYKLLMNASYGKLIQKAIKTKKTFIRKSNLKSFVARNHKFIDSYNEINSNLFVVKMRKSVITHFTACHLACNILSMSKRIMNQVMCLAEDSGIKIYYQDTDSMHLHENTIPLLADSFRRKYGTDLIGKHMGQFHTDFDAGDSSASNIRATESIFLGKKCYIDKLKYINKFLNEKTAYHIRVKGIPTQSIRDFDDDYMRTYKRLLSGEKLEFDLAKYCPLQIDGDYRARKKISGLTRSLKF